MTWKPNRKEIEAVLQLAATERYEHFIKRVADTEELMALRAPGGGWTMVGTSDGECLPVWPHGVYAERCGPALAEPGADPKAIPLDAFLKRWVPGLTKDGIKVAVFPNTDGKGVIVEPQRLGDDLRRYVEEWYGEGD